MHHLWNLRTVIPDSARSILWYPHIKPIGLKMLKLFANKKVLADAVIRIERTLKCSGNIGNADFECLHPFIEGWTQTPVFRKQTFGVIEGHWTQGTSPVNHSCWPTDILYYILSSQNDRHCFYHVKDTPCLIYVNTCCCLSLRST